MTFNLLLDLDDTLLNTNLDAFLNAYFRKLAMHMSKYVPPEKFTRVLLRATQIMYESKRTDQTLEQVFNDHFYTELGVDRADVVDSLEQFYDEVFPSLGELTTPRPEAIRLVDWAFSQGWNVAIATDPLFPRKAILHRLRWAGLAPENYPFALISDFHSFHFAKASVSFYPEFLERMGWVDGPVLMVGDSLERDILPSRQAGMPAFWLTTNESGSQNGVPQGKFPELREFLEKTDLTTLKVNYGTPQALMPFLRATPASIHCLLKTHPDRTWNKRPQPEEWSLLEVVCHLRDVEAEVNLPRIETILREENAFISGQTTDHWAEERMYSRQDLPSAFADFVSARLKLIDLLPDPASPNWNRRAQHTFLGPTSLRELVEFMIDHDRLHIRQGCAALQEPLTAPGI